MNRIAARITALLPRVAELSTEKRHTLDATLTLDASEYVAYQNLQAQAHASGRITSAEAQTVYVALTEWDSTNTATSAGTTARIVVTQLMRELLEESIKNGRKLIKASQRNRAAARG